MPWYDSKKNGYHFIAVAICDGRFAAQSLSPRMAGPGSLVAVADFHDTFDLQRRISA
jgi:hypothetical protein